MIGSEFIPERTVERLCAYRRILSRWLQQGKTHCLSRELAEEAGITSCQVRRDLMSLETVGTPKKGYQTAKLADNLGLLIEGEDGQRAVLIGAGKLGGALLHHLDKLRQDLAVVAAFETDASKIGLEFDGVPCWPISDLARVIREERVLIAILAVPAAVAPAVAQQAVDAGARALLNLTPAHLKVPTNVFVQNVDISISLEKAAYFAQVMAKKELFSRSAPKKRKSLGQ